MTQAQLAKELNISRPALANYEIGKREPSIEILIKLARYFNVSVDYLVDNTIEMLPRKKP